MSDAVGPEHGPVIEEYRKTMNELALGIDEILNGRDCPKDKKQTGFCLLVFPFEDAASPHQERMNYISNADMLDMRILFKEMVARFEYRMQRGGKA